MKALIIVVAASSLAFAQGEPSFQGRTYHAWLADLQEPDPEIRLQALSALGQIRDAPAEEVVPAVTTALADAQPKVRAQAAWALANAGPSAAPAVGALAHALADADSQVRRSAATALGGVGEAAKEAVPALIQASSDHESIVRFEVALALATIAPEREETPQILGAVMEEAESYNRSRAIWAMAGLLEKNPAAVPYLDRALEGKDERSRLQAALALCKAGDPTDKAAMVLVRASASDQEGVYEAAREGAARLGRDAAPGLARCLSSEDPDLRAAAADLLGRLGAAAETVIPQLRDALRDQEPRVRMAAALALAASGAKDEDTIRALLDSARGKNYYVARSVAESLVRIGATSVPLITVALSDADPLVRFAGAMAAGDLRSAARDAIPALGALLADPDPTVRYAAVGAIEKMGAAIEPAIPAVVRALRGADQNSITTLQGALRACRKASIPSLCEALRAPDAPMRTAAADALGGFGSLPEPSVANLAGALADSDAKVRAAVANAMGRLGQDLGDSSKALIAAVADADADVRDRAVAALGNHPELASQTVPLFIRGLQDSEENVRLEAARSLQRLGPLARDAQGPLLEAAKTGSGPLCQNAAWALVMIGPDPKIVLPALPEIFRAHEKDWEARRALLGVCAKIGVEAIPVLLDTAYDSGMGATDITDTVKRMGTAAIEPLIAYAKGDDAKMRKKVLSLLQNLGEPGMAAIEKAYEDPDPAVRLRLVQALDMRWGIVPLPRVQIQALHDPDAGVRGAATTSLIDSPYVSSETVSIVIEALQGTEGQTRANLLEILERAGPNAEAALPALVAEMKDTSKSTGWYAARALGHVGHAGFAPLMGALHADDPELRRRAALGLGEIREQDEPKATAALIEAAHDPDKQVRSAALQGLDSDRRPPADILPVLVEAMKDGDEDVRYYALAGIGNLGMDAKLTEEAVRAVCRAVRDPSPNVRSRVADVLRQVGTQALAGAVPYLEEAMRDPDPAIASYAVELLGGVGESGVASLAKRLEGADAGRRLQIVAAMGRSGDRAVPTLAGLLTDPDVLVRRAAAQTIASVLTYAPNELVTSLANALRDEDASVRASCAIALGRLGDQAKAARPALEALVADPVEAVRSAAAAALALIPEK